MLDQNLVDEALHHLGGLYDKVKQFYDVTHPLLIEWRWRTTQAFYKRHFFGDTGYREELIDSIQSQIVFLRQSSHILGIEHPTTLEMWASLKFCWEEQLDWTQLDDAVSRHRLQVLDKIPRPPGHKVFWK